MMAPFWVSMSDEAGEPYTEGIDLKRKVLTHFGCLKKLVIITTISGFSMPKSGGERGTGQED